MTIRFKFSPVNTHKHAELASYFYSSGMLNCTMLCPFFTMEDHLLDILLLDVLIFL